MKKEHDFSKGARGKFYFPNAEFNLPIYLEPEIEDFICKLIIESKSYNLKFRHPNLPKNDLDLFII